MMDWTEFFRMGGHGFYVWSSWGASFTLIALILILAKRRAARIRQQLITNQQRKEKFNQ